MTDLKVFEVVPSRESKSTKRDQPKSILSFMQESNREAAGPHTLVVPTKDEAKSPVQPRFSVRELEEALTAIADRPADIFESHENAESLTELQVTISPRGKPSARTDVTLQSDSPFVYDDSYEKFAIRKIQALEQSVKLLEAEKKKEAKSDDEKAAQKKIGAEYYATLLELGNAYKDFSEYLNVNDVAYNRRTREYLQTRDQSLSSNQYFQFALEVFNKLSSSYQSEQYSIDIYSQALAALGDLMLWQNNFKEAQDFYWQASNVFPEDEQVVSAFAKALKSELLQKINNIPMQYLMVMENMADTFDTKNSYDDAQKYYQTALQYITELKHYPEDYPDYYREILKLFEERLTQKYEEVEKKTLAKPNAIPT